MAVPRKARVLLPLAWATSSLPSYGCTSSGASIIAFGLGYLIFAIIWPYAVWREYYCLWPGLPHLCHRMAVRRMARVLLPLAWVNSSLLSYGCTPYTNRDGHNAEYRVQSLRTHRPVHSSRIPCECVPGHVPMLIRRGRGSADRPGPLFWTKKSPLDCMCIRQGFGESEAHPKGSQRSVICMCLYMHTYTDR